MREITAMAPFNGHSMTDFTNFYSAQTDKIKGIRDDFINNPEYLSILLFLQGLPVIFPGHH